MMARAALPLLACLAAAHGVAGCASLPTAAAPGFQVLGSRAAGRGDSVRAGDLEPSAAGSARWATPGAGTNFEVRTEPIEGGVARTDPRGTRSLAVSPDGAVSLRWVLDSSDRSRTVFDPPLLLAPPELHAGDEASASAGVRTERAGVAGDDSGNAQRTVRIASVDRVRTPLGEFEAIRVDATLTMKVPFASMRRETSTWVLPGTGPVAVHMDERILVMGVVPRNASDERVLLPRDGGFR